MGVGSQGVRLGGVVRQVLRWVLVLGGAAILIGMVSELLSAETRSDTVTAALLGLGALLIVFGASGARIDSFEGPGGWKASLTTSNGALHRSAQTIVVAEAFAADSTLPPSVRAEALQVVAAVRQAQRYEKAVGDLLERLHPRSVDRAQPFDQADFEVRMGPDHVIRVEAVWLDRHWSSSKRWVLFGPKEQKEWEERYLGAGVTVVVTNLAPPAPEGANQCPTYVQVTGVNDTHGAQQVEAALVAKEKDASQKAVAAALAAKEKGASEQG